jgi:hypothetical protein
MKINYDVTIPETETAFMMFWRKYVMKRTMMFSLVFLIAAGLSVNMVLNGMRMAGGIITGLSLGFMVNLWLKPYRLKKKIAMACEMTKDEKYSAMFGEKEIEIETITANEEVDKSIYTIGAEELFSKETDGLFLLYVNKALVHVFPKRCLSEQEIEELRNYFTSKGI